MDLEDKIELHRLFWQGGAPRPLLGFFFTEQGPPGEMPPCPAIDIDTPVEDVVEKYRAAAARAARAPGDRVPEISLNYGTSFLPALAGAEYREDGHTSWCIPTGKTAEELRVEEFDPDRPLWRGYARKLRALVEADIPGAVVSTGALTGPMEALLGLLGGEQLSLDMFDSPDAVKERAGELTRLFLRVFEAQWELLGQPAGNAGFRVYVPGRSCLFSEDGLALVGPDQFDQFFREPIERLCRPLDVPFIHTHSAALPCYEKLGEVEELAGIEISNDPGGPPLEALIEAGTRFQAEGKSVMFSNWMRPLTEDQVEMLLDAADERRSLVTLTVETLDDAERYLTKVRERFGTL